MSAKEISIIGPAIIDVLAGAVSEQIFQVGSQPMDFIKLSFGGDALNESIALSKLGKQVELITKVGNDEAGDRVIRYLRECGLSTDCVQIEDGLETGMNIVLVDQNGERHFLTNPRGSLRKLREADIEPYIDNMANIVSFASMFVSPTLDIPAMERIFKKIKAKKDRILVVDMTTAKQGERLEDLECLFPYIDFLLPNEVEIQRLTGETDPVKNLQLMMSHGVCCAVLKLGDKGCIIRKKDEEYIIPAYPIEKTVDTTGAGDCFAAGFLWGLAQEMSLCDCGRFACAAASCSVEKSGATEGVSSLEEVMLRYQYLCK